MKPNYNLMQLTKEAQGYIHTQQLSVDLLLLIYSSSAKPKIKKAVKELKWKGLFFSIDGGKLSTYMAYTDMY